MTIAICSYDFLFRLTSLVFLWPHFAFLVAFYVLVAVPCVPEVAKKFQRRKMKLEQIKYSMEAFYIEKMIGGLNLVDHQLPMAAEL